MEILELFSICTRKFKMQKNYCLPSCEADINLFLLLLINETTNELCFDSCAYRTVPIASSLSHRA